MNDLTDFIQNELYPLLFDRIPEAFPSMDFQKKGGDWRSKYKLDGTPSHDGRTDKSVITRRKHQRVIEQGGESLSLIDFYMKQNKKSFIEAVKDLSQICGLELPRRQDSEQYIAYKERQDKLEAAVTKMKKALFTEDGKEVLEYLQESRGYSDSFIKWAGFGFCSNETASTLIDIFTYRNKDGQKVCSLPYDVGRRYFLAIPYTTGGAIKGLVFRATDKDTKPKYKNAFVSASATKKYNLFGLSGLNLTGKGEKDKDITIVEGEIDALRASFEGVVNVTAAAGGNISTEALQEAKRRGVTRVTLLFDTEETEEQQKQTCTKVDKAISSIQEVGLSAFVCFLPREDGKTDVDSFLRKHSGADLTSVIDKAIPASEYLFHRITEAAIERQGDGQQFAFKDLDEYKRQTIELCNKVKPTERERIIRLFSNATGGYITPEALREEADMEKALANQNRQKREVINLASDVYRLARNGQTDKALSLMREKTASIQRISMECEYSKLLRLPTASDIKSGFQKRPAGIRTLFTFGDGDKSERLILPSGALTYICAPTSHGKSRMLQNLALQLSTDKTDGDTLYFTFEEDETTVKLQLLNIYADMFLSKNNLRSLNTYYRSGDEGYFNKGVDIAAFKRKEESFMSLLESGKLRVYYEDYDSTQLVEAIRYLSKQTKVKAVFVDYIQLLHICNTRLQRKDELKEICKEFMKLAVETGLPIILAAQLNREVLSPIEMSIQNIAEASDIEHSANTVLMLWNSKVRPLQKSGYFTEKNGEKLSKEAAVLQAKGFDIGQEGKLYAILAKNRGGARNIDAVLEFNGNTGKITPNITPERPEQAQVLFGRGKGLSPF